MIVTHILVSADRSPHCTIHTCHTTFTARPKRQYRPRLTFQICGILDILSKACVVYQEGGLPPGDLTHISFLWLGFLLLTKSRTSTYLYDICIGQGLSDESLARSSRSYCFPQAILACSYQCIE